MVFPGYGADNQTYNNQDNHQKTYSQLNLMLPN